VTSGEVAEIFEAPDVNTSTADDACQRLKVVSESLEKEIQLRGSQRCIDMTTQCEIPDHRTEP
jgi:hypothetical protein